MSATLTPQWIAPLLNVIAVALPLLILSLALLLFPGLGYWLGMKPLLDAHDAMRDALYAREGLWHGSVTKDDLQVFAPLLAKARDTANRCAYLTKVGFAMCRSRTWNGPLRRLCGGSAHSLVSSAILAVPRKRSCALMSCRRRLAKETEIGRHG